MIDEIRDLLDDYTKWLRVETSIRELNDWVEINTPYLDRHNDSLQIYVGRQNGGYVLTDDGYVLDDLEQSGVTISGGSRQAILDVTLNGFGVRRIENKLRVTASEDDFASRKHNLIQAMLAVNDMFYLASPRVASLFLEDVAGWLDSADVRYTPSVKFTGASGYDHMYNFVIPRSSEQPERMMRAITTPNRNNAQSMAFSWIDTKDTRPLESHAYAILNDSNATVPAGVLDAMRNYDVRPVLWSRRDESLLEFAS